MKKTRGHVVYKLEDGTRLVGTTTVVGLLAKPQLILWANRLGLNGIDSTKYVDDLATVGTLTHEKVKEHFTGEKVDLDEYSKHDIERSENCLKSFYEWVKSKKIEPILNEAQLISESLRYGGTIDFYGTIDGKKTLVDFKTSSACYDEHLIQLAAYWELLEGNGYQVEEAIIVRIGRTPDEGFEVRQLTSDIKYKQIFGHLLNIYYLLKGKG